HHCLAGDLQPPSVSPRPPDALRHRDHVSVFGREQFRLQLRGSLAIWLSSSQGRRSGQAGGMSATATHLITYVCASTSRLQSVTTAGDWAFDAASRAWWRESVSAVLSTRGPYCLPALLI